MIVDRTVKINISERNITYFKEKGYDAVLKSIIEVKVDDLKRFSRININVKCDQCEKKAVMKYTKYMDNYERYGFYTCKKCSYTKKKISNNINFGVDNPMMLTQFIEKGKQTKKEKYGNENYNNKEKHIKTNLDKFGFKHHLQNKDIMNKQKKTNLNKFGVEFVCQNNEIKQKIKKTKLFKYGDSYFNNANKRVLTKLEHYDFNIKTINETEFLCECKNKNHNYTINKNLFYYRLNNRIDLCLLCNPLSNISESEKKLQNFISSIYSGKILLNNKKTIKPYELDIFLPELNIAFEFNGLYWHCEIHKDKNFHKMKSDICDSQNIQLFHIYEDDWNNKQNIIKSMIINKLKISKYKIYARKCEIKTIKDNLLIRDFLNNNHLQGYIGSSIKLGLFYNDELVSLMTFGKNRKIMNNESHENEYEMLRFCNKLNTNVIGGASKLFRYFLNTYNPAKIISYADRNYSNGDLYKYLGFNFIHITEPNYYYIINSKKIHRFSFRKDLLVKDGYDPNKSEHQIMLERKIYRIYNSGNYKFVYEN